ncbi:MAG: DUF3830 family protein [Nocardioidaceae bacterium]
MARYLDISLDKRGVSCVARLLDEQAPRTCAGVWDALPLGADVYHAKYARNEIYTFVPTFAEVAPGPENTTITPIPGDVVYFPFEQWQMANPGYGYAADTTQRAAEHVIDLAVFYERNNLLLNPDYGFVPGNVFATIVRGLDEIAAAAQDLWRRGFEGETLTFARHVGEP